MIPILRHFVRFALLWMPVILSVLLGSVTRAQADLVYWTNSSGGLYSEPLNWSPNAVPGILDSLQFTQSGSYAITVDSGATNASAFFLSGSVTQAISADMWHLTDEWRVGEGPGSTSRVTLVSGLLAVTNGDGAAVLSVGRNGTGELAIRGGNVVTDFLQATNGSRSILSLAHGSLTTLHGAVVTNAGKVNLGTTPGNKFVWNVLGGTNSILTGRFDYGGLTLGGRAPTNGLSELNIEGPETLLTVPGLDFTGGQILNVRSGATLHTDRVQWDIGSGRSNLVVISGSGSAWINDEDMWLTGVGQTLIVTNGGYFRTGGILPFGYFGDLDAFTQTNNRIIITGSNSWFYSDGTANFGISYSSPVIPLDNLLLVTNGGRFWARQLTYGSGNIVLGSVSRPGNLINVADGDLWISSLSFAVGTLRIEAGTGIIDALNMTGGTNAVLQTRGNLYVGHHGDLAAGELRVGGASMSIALNGELQIGGWQLGVFPGDTGNVTMTGGRAFVTNSSQTASLVVGGAGSGVLRVNDGLVQADLLAVGSAGTVSVNGASTLRIKDCTAPASTISINGATLEFSSGTPAIPADAITTTNAVVSFRGANGARMDLNDPEYLGRIRRYGRTVLQLVQTTNASLESLVFRDNDASNWSKLILNGGTSTLQAGSILIDANSSLAATNTTATISGSFTNRGPFLLENSALRFVGPVVLSEASTFQGSQGFLRFAGGLHLPATDVVVPAGISVQASSINSAGGKLVIDGGGIIPNDDGTVVAGMIRFQDGWVTYFETPDAPVNPPVGLIGALGLELIRSTNAPVISHIFGNGGGGYERLRMGSGSAWRSQQLVVGPSGVMIIADASASIALTSGVFRVEHGGLFRDDTGGTSHVGFSSTSSNANVTISGSDSTWSTPRTVSVGVVGSRNQLLVESGGKLCADSTIIGGFNAGNSNRVLLNGTNTRCFATNGLTLAGSQNQFLVQTGAVFFGSQILANSGGTLVSLTGTGAVVNCATQFVLGSQSKLQVSGGANLLTSNALLNGNLGTAGEITGCGSLLKVTGSLTVNVPNVAQPSRRTNSFSIIDKGVVVCSSLSLGRSSPVGQAAMSIQAGQLFVTNAAGTGNVTMNGLLDLNRGLLRADKVTVSNAAFSSFNIRAGKAEWSACDFAAGIPLLIGDGTNLASLNLLGSTNTSRSGLEVSRYSRLTGRGLIVGAVTNRGEFWPSFITIQDNLVLDSSSDLTFSIAGAPELPQNSFLDVTGSVSLAGNLRLSVNPGVSLSPAQSFVLLQYGSLASGFSNIAFGNRLLTQNRLASFRIENTGTSIIATDFQSEDLDGDGIQDAWAMQQFGRSPLLPGTGPDDLDGDKDGDRLRNRDEFLLGTNPNDPSSTLQIYAEAVGQTGVAVHFQYLPNLTYRMSSSNDLLNWTETPIEELSFDSNGLAVWSDTTASVSGNQFYRLIVQ